MAKKAYDVDNVVFMINGIEVSDALDGEKIVVDRVADLKTARYSLKGKPLITRNPQAKHATFKFALLKDHPINAVIQSGESFSISVMDLNTNKTHISKVAHAMKDASDEAGTDAQGEYEVLGEYTKSTTLGAL